MLGVGCGGVRGCMYIIGVWKETTKDYVRVSVYLFGVTQGEGRKRNVTLKPKAERNVAFPPTTTTTLHSY